MRDISLLLLLSNQSRKKKKRKKKTLSVTIDNIEFGIILKEARDFHGSLRDVIS